MGIDFLRKSAKSYKKSLDKARADLCRPDLFTRQPSEQPRAYSASTHRRGQLQAGDLVAVRLQGKTVVAQKGRHVVATFDAPPEELLMAMEESYGEASGTVEAVFEITGTVEISIC